jgi:hypothetical protein
MDSAFDRCGRLVKRGDLIGLRAWLRAGGDANLADRFGWTLLMLAALHGRTDVVGVLLEAGADARLQNRFGDTAKACALSSGHRRTAEHLGRALGDPPIEIGRAAGPHKSARRRAVIWFVFLTVMAVIIGVALGGYYLIREARKACPIENAEGTQQHEPNILEAPDPAAPEPAGK